MTSDFERPLEFDSILVRLAVATAVGAVLGLNRELRGKSAGLRTMAMVSLGTALAMVLSIEVTAAGKIADIGAVTRTIQGVLTGVGFLGAGVIFRDGESGRVKGLTTAATVWLVSCLGMACGAGRWRSVATATALAMLVLMVGGPIEKWCERLVKSRDPEVRPADPAP